jgi:hypothetical protein
MITDNKEIFVLRPLDSTNFDEINSKVKSKHKGFNYKKRLTKQTLIDKHTNEVHPNADQELLTNINSHIREDMPQVMPHVLYRVNQSETEFCDMAFISIINYKYKLN